jgi:hypothetical protein
MLPALIVGALTAWYLGMRAGIIAAAVTFGALMLGMFVPGLNLAVYALILAWSAALYFLGAKMSKAGGSKGLSNFGGLFGGVTGMAGQASAWVKKQIAKTK